MQCGLRGSVVIILDVHVTLIQEVEEVFSSNLKFLLQTFLYYSCSERDFSGVKMINLLLPIRSAPAICGQEFLLQRKRLI